MTDQEKVAAFVHMCPLIVLTHAIQHYTSRIGEVEKERFPKVSELMFLTGTFNGLKKNLPIFYN